MTNFGKVLVYLNTFAAIVLFGWALSLYTNRLDYFDRTDGETKIEGQLTQLNAEVKRYNELIKGSQVSYAATSERLKYQENVRTFRQEALKKFMAKIQGVDSEVRFLNLNRMDKSALLSFPSSPAADGSFDPLGTIINGLDGKPLRGLGALRKLYGELCQQRRDLQAKILKHREDYAALCKVVDVNQDEVIRNKVMFDNLKDEQEFLNDALINWEEQLRILELRQNQLKVRLEAAGGTPPAGK
jgi:chromosome segregation ATPase